MTSTKSLWLALAPGFALLVMWIALYSLAHRTAVQASGVFPKAPGLPWLCVPSSASGSAYACTATYVDGTAVPAGELASPPQAQSVVLVPDVTNTAGIVTLSVNAGANPFQIRINAFCPVCVPAAGEFTPFFPLVLTFSTASPNTRWALLERADGNGQTLIGGATPGLGTCVSGSALAVGATNNAFTVNLGSGMTTSCAINFGQDFIEPPTCIAADDSLTVAVDISPPPTVHTVTVTLAASLANGHLYVHCF